MLKLFVVALRYGLPLFVPLAILLATRPHTPMERRVVARITTVVLVVAALAAATLAWLRLNTNLIDVPTMNFYLVPVMLICSLGFLGMSWWFGAADLYDIKQSAKHRALLVASLLTAVSIIINFGFEYAFSTDEIVLMGSSPLETESLARFSGFAFGSLLVVIAGWAYVRATRLVPAMVRLAITTAVFLVVIGPRSILLYQQFAIRGFLPRSRTIFELVLWIQNANTVILLALVVLTAIPGIIAIWFGSKPVNVSGPEARLAKADRITRRHFLELALGGTVVFVAALTVGRRVAESVPELSPIEPSTVEGNVVSVSRELVSDGHLHRFAYVTKDGTQVRFIVIQKNAVAYGCGLDACEICGESGYYEDGGKVICRRCGVMMNIQTIGFPGGCNPIPIKYEVGPKELRFFADELSGHAKIFKTKII